MKYLLTLAALLAFAQAQGNNNRHNRHNRGGRNRNNRFIENGPPEFIRNINNMEPEIITFIDESQPRRTNRRVSRKTCRTGDYKEILGKIYNKDNHSFKKDSEVIHRNIAEERNVVWITGCLASSDLPKKEVNTLYVKLAKSDNEVLEISCDGYSDDDIKCKNKESSGSVEKEDKTSSKSSDDKDDKDDKDDDSDDNDSKSSKDDKEEKKSIEEEEDDTGDDESSGDY